METVFSVTNHLADKNQPSFPKSSESKIENISEDVLREMYVNPNRRLSEKFQIYPLSVDEKLQIDMFKASMLFKKFNSLDDADWEGKRKTLDELLNPACSGKPMYIVAPFVTCFGYNLTIGENFFADYGCVLMDCLPITIGDNCIFGSEVQIFTGTHPVKAKDRRIYSIAFPVQIGNNVLIGGGSVISSGVTIGDNVTVAAGSVVVKDVPSNVLVGGNPAKIIRQLDV